MMIRKSVIDGDNGGDDDDDDDDDDDRDLKQRRRRRQWKHHEKNEFASFQTLSRLFGTVQFVKCRRLFQELNF